MFRTTAASALALGLMLASAGGALGQYDTRYDESGMDEEFDPGQTDERFNTYGIDKEDMDTGGKDWSDLDPSGIDNDYDTSGIENPRDAPPIEPTPGGTDLGTSAYGPD